MTDNVLYMFENPKSDDACWRTLLIEILREVEAPDPEGAVYRALQHFGNLEAADNHIKMLVAWEKEGVVDAESRFWNALEETRKS